MIWNYFGARKFNFGIFFTDRFFLVCHFLRMEKKTLKKKSICKKHAKMKFPSSKIMSNHEILLFFDDFIIRVFNLVKV